MRIALFTDGIYPYVIGGMQKHSFYLAKYLALNNVEVDLYHTATDLSKIKFLDCFSAEENKWITSIPVQYPPTGKIPGHYIREMQAYSASLFQELLKRKAVDFIYVQGLCGMYLLGHKQEVKIPIGVNFHGLEMFQKTANLRTKLEQYLFKRPVLKSMRSADVVFSLGGKLTEIIKSEGIPEKKISQIPIGLDESWLRKTELSENTTRKFIFIGRYERRKGLEELTLAIKALLPMYNFSMEFIGAIPEEKKIQSERVLYHGSLSDVEQIKKILLGADVLICPSYSEGMPTVILEAMASGLGIIASNVGAIAEQVDASNGILINAGNVDELMEAIAQLLKMANTELEQLKRNSIKKIKESFLWGQIIQKTIAEIRRFAS